MALHRFECAVCGKKATKKSKRAIYCSPTCSQRAYEKRKGIKAPEFISKKKTAKKTETIAQVQNPYLQMIDMNISPLEKEKMELAIQKDKLLKKFNSITTKSESFKKYMTDGVTIGAAVYGMTKIDKGSTTADILYYLLGVPMAFRFASKNLLPEIMKPEELNKAIQLDEIRRKITYTDERMNEITITLANEKAVRKMAKNAIEILNPQIERTKSYTAIDAQEMQKIKRTMYKLTGKWKYFLGDIEQNFKAVIYGKPKQGKSHFAIQFAQYLHSTFGDVAYFAAEEGAAVSMENKISKWNAKFKVIYNILGIQGIRDYVEKYNPKFVFIDSMTRLDLTYDNVKFLVDEYIDMAWILITQSTKHNSHRGSQELTHLSDSNIQVANKIAYQQGRTVNGDTELQIFDNDENTSK